MELVAEGHSNKSVGQQLGISLHTVNKHFAKICMKLHFTSRIEVAKAVWQKKHDAEIAQVHERYSCIDLQSN
jgi:DNA-binding NarL/FixJ family response regulator